MEPRMTYTSARGAGLRERKRARTRATIISVALELFANNGYQGTTLAQIADAAEVAPSTLHAYFPAKEDILFSGQDQAAETARTGILERPADETLTDALLAWLTNIVPELFGANGEALVRQREIIGTDEALIAAQRLRRAQLEDVFAEIFAADSGQSADDLHPRLMASVVTNTFVAVTQWWYAHRTDEQPARRKLYALDATYVTRLIAAADTALKTIPSP
jgi:AcrR family transcriptional regulator